MLPSHTAGRSALPIVTTIAVILVLSLSYLSGCTRKPQPEQAVDAAAKRYSAVQSGMTKQEVVIALGEPAKRQGTLWRWEVTANPQSNASLELQFDAADNAQPRTSGLDSVRGQLAGLRQPLKEPLHSESSDRPQH